MFTGNMVTEAIPARVFSLYKIANSKKDITRSELQALMEPPEIYEGTSYFAAILRAATELKLVEVQDNIIVPIVTKDQIKSIEDMRLYAISKLESFSDSQFYRYTNAVVNMNERIYKHSSISDAQMLSYISARIGEQVTAPMARGWRFWAQFLGFGQVNGMAFLPNAYVFVKDVLKLLNLEKNKEYPIDEFMTLFDRYGRILSGNLEPDRNMNIALSSAFRELHDNNEIELIYHSDAMTRWFLYPSSELFNEQVATIRFKGVK